MLMQIQNNPALKDGLEQLLKMSKIRAIDMAFADFIYSEESALDASDNLSTPARECLTMLAAFASAQSGEQHSCIDLEKFPLYVTHTHFPHNTSRSPSTLWLNVK